MNFSFPTEKLTNMIFAENLKAYRKLCGLSQLDLARYTGLSRTTISSYERAIFGPTGYNAFKIATVLYIQVDALFDYTTNEPENFDYIYVQGKAFRVKHEQKTI